MRTPTSSFKFRRKAGKEVSATFPKCTAGAKLNLQLKLIFSKIGQTFPGNFLQLLQDSLTLSQTIFDV